MLRPPLTGARTFALSGNGTAAGHTGRLTLIHEDDAPRQLRDVLIDGRYLPRSDWDLNGDGVLQWKDGGTGKGGLLQFDDAMERGTGTGFAGATAFALQAELPPITYQCGLAAGTGAYANGMAPDLSLYWNSGEASWTGANWVPACLNFTYQLQQQVIVQQPFYDFQVTFTDLQTGNAWTPGPNQFSCMIDADFVMHMTLNDGFPPPADDRSALSGDIPTVFPFQIALQLSPTALEVTGAMLTVVDAQNGTVLGVSGSTPAASVAGSYALSGGGAESFAVLDGAMKVAGQVPQASLAGHALTWSGLTAEQQAASGLPDRGTARFDPSGRSFVIDGTSLAGSQLGGDALASRISAPPNSAAAGSAGPVSAPGFATPSATQAAEQAPVPVQGDGTGSVLSLQSLALMTPFVDDNGWYDAVQQAAMADFNQILLYWMTPDLRTAYWNCDQPTLPADLQSIAAMAPSGDNPQAWYQSLSVAFLTQAMSSWEEEGASTLNATRAQNWLKQTVAASPIFAMQSQALYTLEFTKAVPVIGQFLTDQKTNAAGYAPQIQSDAQSWIGSLTAQIADPETAAAVAAMVDNLSQTAEAQDLYWAYTYFRYATQDTQLASLLILLVSQDGTAYMRRVQSNAVVLSILDPSNLFANSYLSAVQAHMLSSLLPLFSDYGSPQPGLAEAVLPVLQSISATYAQSSDGDLAGIANTAATLSMRTDLSSLIATMQQAAVQSASSGGWATAVPGMVASVSGLIGVEAANMLCATLASLTVGGAAAGVTDWSISLNRGSGSSGGLSASSILSMAKYATQILYGVSKWGTALAASLDGGPMTLAAAKGLFSTEMLVQANRNLETGFSRWLVGNQIVEEPSEMFGTMFQEDVVDSRSMVIRIFGRNLDDFVAIRMSALFSFAGLVIAGIGLLDATTGEEEIAGWISFSGSALSLAASAGKWTVQAFELSEGLSSFFSVLGALGTVASAVGIVYVLYRWITFTPSPTLVQGFVSGYAEPAGFFMPYDAEVDDFTGYSVTGEPSRVGLSWQTPGQKDQVLTVSPSGSLTAGPLDYGYATLLFVQTDGNGQSTVSSVSGGKRLLLTAGTNGTVSFAAPLAAGDPAAATQLWRIVLQATPVMDGANPEAGSFQIQSLATLPAGWLAWQNGSAVLATTGIDWVLTQSPMAVGGLTMPDVALFTWSQAATISPSTSQPGSTPQNWTVQPALPAFLCMDPAMGTVSIPPGAPQPLPVTPVSSHTVTVSNGIPGYTQSATFSVSVGAPATV